jgi:hypothetical protein
MTDAFPRLPTFYLPHGGGPCLFMEWSRGPVARDNDRVLSVTLSGFRFG